MVPSLKFGFVVLGYVACTTFSVLRVAQAVADVPELREYFDILSQALGNIPGCPDFASLPDYVLEEGVECLKREVRAVNSTEYDGNGYPGPCSSACREYYGYFGAECYRAEDKAWLSFWETRQGSVPVGIDRRLFLGLWNLASEESDEINDIYDIDYLDDIIENLSEPGPVSVGDTIDACDVPTKGINSSGSTPQSWSLAGFLTAALMLL